ncbi:MAG: polysaccharide deacetylase family protein [Angelakisella sp.]|nr:polysaccharide deacetylase family protein [Angelakisella sp.]
MNPILRRCLALALTLVVAFSTVAAWNLSQEKAVPAMVPQDAPPIEMVVLMYHGIMKRESRAGAYIITPAALEQDLKYIQKEGFNTVVMEDIIAYVHEGRPLPEKPIMITFDDGYYNNYLYAFPLLKKYNMKAVISIIGSETDKFTNLPNDISESYSHMTWPMIQEMIDSGLVEFQSHSYNLHKVGKSRKGCGKSSSESDSQYQTVLREDLGKLQNRYAEMVQIIPTTFTYPFGSVNKLSYDVLKKVGFRASLDAQGKIFYLTRDEECLWRIPRYNRPWGTTAQKIITKAYSTAQSNQKKNSISAFFSQWKLPFFE